MSDNKPLKGKIKKVVAEIMEVTQPTFDANWRCPYCKAHEYDHDIEEDNLTKAVTCWNCKKKYKVKIPKFI